MSLITCMVHKRNYRDPDTGKVLLDECEKIESYSLGELCKNNYYCPKDELDFKMPNYIVKKRYDEFDEEFYL